MAKNSKLTSRRVASKASKVLRDGRYSKTSKVSSRKCISSNKAN